MGSLYKLSNQIYFGRQQSDISEGLHYWAAYFMQPAGASSDLVGQWSSTVVTQRDSCFLSVPR